MKLKDLVNLIKHISLSQPDVHSFYEGDVYKAMNANAAIDYASVVLTYNNFTHNEDDESTTYNMYLFYVDREVSDDSNQLDVQSHSIDVLKSIIHTIENYDVIVNQSIYHPFKERFGDECSGAYAEIALTVIDGECDDFFIDVDEAAKEEIERLEAQVSSLKRQVNNLQKDIDDMTDLEVTENGEYVPEGIGYKKVSVDVQGLKYEDNTVLYFDEDFNIVGKKIGNNGIVDVEEIIPSRYVTVGNGINRINHMNYISTEIVYLSDSVEDVRGARKDLIQPNSTLKIVYGGKIKNFGRFAFYNCQCLTVVEGLKFAETIDSFAFYNCTNFDVSQYIFRAKSIGIEAFLYCPIMEGLVIEGDETDIKERAFGYMQTNGSIFDLTFSRGVKISISGSFTNLYVPFDEFSSRYIGDEEYEYFGLIGVFDGLDDMRDSGIDRTIMISRGLIGKTYNHLTYTEEWIRQQAALKGYGVEFF